MRLTPDSTPRLFSPRRAPNDAHDAPSALDLSRPEPRCYSREPDSDADDDSAGSAPWQPGPSTRQHAGQSSYGPSQRSPRLRSVGLGTDDDSDDSSDDIPFDPVHSVAQSAHHRVHQHDPHVHDETEGTRPSRESISPQIAAHQSHYQHVRHDSGSSTRSNYYDDSEDSEEEMEVDEAEGGRGGQDDWERRRSPPAHSRTHPQSASHHRREAPGSVSLSAPAPARARPTSSSVPPVSPSISASSTGPPTPALPPSAPSPPVPQPPTPHVPPTFSFNPNRYPAYDHNNRRIGLEHLQYNAPPREPRRGGYYRPQTRDYAKTFHHSTSLPVARTSTRSDKGKGKEPARDSDRYREEEWEEDRAREGPGDSFRSESPAVGTLRPVSPSPPAPPRPRGRGRTASSSASPGAQSKGTLVSLAPEPADPAAQLRQLVNIDADNEDIEGIGLESLADPPPGEKPNYPLPTLIKLAIHGSEKKRLTLQEIYQALEDRFVWFKERTGDAAWKNSIRHNLSLRKCFVRVQRPITEPGKGSYWMIDLNQGEGNKRVRKRNKKPTKSQLAQQAYEESQRTYRLNPMPPVNTFPAPSRRREDDMHVDELEDEDDFDDSPPRTMSRAQHPEAGPSRRPNPPHIDESNIDPELRPASQSSGHVVGDSRRPSTLNTRQTNRRSPYPSTSPTAPTPSTSQQLSRPRRSRNHPHPTPRLTLPQLPPPVLPHIPPARPFNLPSPQMHNTASRLSQPLPPMRLAQTPPPGGAARSTSLSFGQSAFGRTAFGQSSLPAVGAGGLGRAILSAPDKRREEESAERSPVHRFVRPPPRAGQVYVMEGGLLVAKYRKDVRSDEEIVEEPEEDEKSGSEGRGSE